MDMINTITGWINRLFNDVEPFTGWLILALFVGALSKAFRMFFNIKIGGGK